MERQFEDYAKKVIEATNAVEPNAYWQMRQRMFGPGNAAGYRYRNAWRSTSALTKPRGWRRAHSHRFTASTSA